MPPSNPWEQFKFGLCFGLGFLVAYGVAQLIAMLFSKAGIHGM